MDYPVLSKEQTAVRRLTVIFRTGGNSVPGTISLMFMQPGPKWITNKACMNLNPTGSPGPVKGTRHFDSSHFFPQGEGLGASPLCL